MMKEERQKLKERVEIVRLFIGLSTKFLLSHASVVILSPHHVEDDMLNPLFAYPGT